MNPNPRLREPAPACRKTSAQHRPLVQVRHGTQTEHCVGCQPGVVDVLKKNTIAKIKHREHMPFSTPATIIMGAVVVYKTILTPR